jgi:hypothetical protein
MTDFSVTVTEPWEATGSSLGLAEDKRYLYTAINR